MKIKLPEKLNLAFGKVSFNVKQHSPEILLVTGIVTFGGTIVTAIIASRKHNELMMDHEVRLEDAKLETLVPVDYDEDEVDEDESGIHYEVDEKARRSAVTKVYLETGLSFVKLYSPVVALGCVSMASFIGMHNIQAGRFAGLLGAFNGLKEASERYQQRNIELNGEENHKMCLNGWKEEVVKEEDENGNVYEEVKKVPLEVPGSSASWCNEVFEFCAPELVDGRGNCFKGTPSFTGYPHEDKIYIEAQQRFLQDKLDAGYPVLLNDCLDALKMDRTVMGMVIGWLPGRGDKIIFDMSDPDNEDFHNFVHGSTCKIRFNPTCVVYDSKTRW